MKLTELSIKRPIFITCLVILLLTIGVISLKKLPVDLFPDVTFPIIVISTDFPSASPEEVETLVSKPIEDSLNNIAGIKQLSSQSIEGCSQVIAEFTQATDIKYAEQQARDKINSIKNKLPASVKDSVIRRIDPADQPILILALKSSLTSTQLYELADKLIKPKLEQINQVALVETLGSSEREIHVDIDRQKLADHDLSITDVSQQIAIAGQNTPIGKVDQGSHEKIFRSLGQYHSIRDIGSVVLKFFGNEVPVTINQIGDISDSTKENVAKTYVNGNASLLLLLYRQPGANTIAVASNVKKKLDSINDLLKNRHLDAKISIVRDGSKLIQDNVKDVEESILIGIALTIIVVYLFLGSARSTFITGLALPTSLLGSFFLMHLSGFSINTMSLMALSLAVGLLVDDAIVVRENIFRHSAKGLTAKEAALKGTQEVLLAVIATSLTVIAVFGPIGFLHGIVGGFFKQFGLTVCFAMIISLFDALTIAPMLSAYIGLGRQNKRNKLLFKIERFQRYLEECYAKVLRFTLTYPKSIILMALFIFISSLFLAKYIPKTFVPPQDTGEFVVALELPPGFNLKAMDEVSKKIDEKIRSFPEVSTVISIVGSHGEPNHTQLYINMVPPKQRQVTTTQFKEQIRSTLKGFKNVKVVVKDVDLIGGGQRPFNLDIMGDNIAELKNVAFKIHNKLKQSRSLLDPEISYQTGKPEMQIALNPNRLKQLGVSPVTLGQELRNLVEGSTPAVYRENGQEYNIRVRLANEQRDLEKSFDKILVPNLNNTLVRLKDLAKPVQSFAPSTISRKDKQRYIRLSADLAPHGEGMNGVINEIHQLFAELKLPPGISYSFVGEAEDFNELIQNMIIAISLGVLFIYLVLASLYESFITPITIMLVLPLATSGAFYGLLITQHSLDIFSMIGCILLFGIATKNSILLVDYTRQLTAEGLSERDAIIKAGTTRLRPILMTTIALIAGMLPIAIGMDEGSKQRTSMGIAVIGGLISSTLLTLLIVPAAYSYIEGVKFRLKRLILKRQPQIQNDLISRDLEETF